MILPVYAYGQKVLKKIAKPLPKDYENLVDLISDMWETMYHARGVGLAAPQVGKSLRLFIIDTMQIEDQEDVESAIKRVFINAQMIEEKGEEISLEEGCLSIPDIRGDVNRNTTIKD